MRSIVAVLLLLGALSGVACGGGSSKPPGATNAAATATQAASSQPSPAAAAPRRAVVFGGGGPPGYAWEVGVLAGLFDQGVDLSQADVFVGSSAGARVTAQLATGLMTIPNLYAQITSGAGSGAIAQPSATADDAYLKDVTKMYFPYSGENTAALRAQIGAKALAAPHPIPESSQASGRAFRVVADWPAKARIVAVDVNDGSVKVFDGSGGVSLGDAVNASSSVPGLMAPYTINGHRYMDGGVAGTNVDAVVGSRLVVAILPFPAGGKTDQEVAAVKAKGGDVFQLLPDAQSLLAIGDGTGTNEQGDPGKEGYRQGAAIAATLKAFWDQPAKP